MTMILNTNNNTMYILLGVVLLWSVEWIRAFDKINHFKRNEGNFEKFAFASYYGDHMVLQRYPKRANVWGYSPNPGEKVQVEFGGRFYPAVVQPNNMWSVLLDPVKDPGPYKITATSPSGEVVLKDVLFGDVWVCSGQSNMEFTVKQAMNASKEIKDADNYPNIRVFTVKQSKSDHPWTDFHTGNIMEPWSVASNKSIGGPDWLYFSAVCWLYGKYLYKHLGYPVGLIDTCWGGTPVEAWSSPDALHVCFNGTENIQTKQRFDDTSQQLDVDSSPQDKSVLWNAMIHPLLNMTIYGAIWYQGEQNAVTGPHTYNCTFPAMIADWRLKWQEASKGQTDKIFPFGFVQLAPYEASAQKFDGFSEIRWHQSADFGYVPNSLMPNTFMSVSIDLPDFLSPWGSVHPRDKQDVAERLVQGSLAVAYNQSKVQFQGPMPTQFVTNTAKKFIQIMYLHQEHLTVNNYAGFEICCFFGSKKLSNKTAWWLPSPITKISKDSVYISTVACPPLKVVGVRYAWRVSPCMYKMCAIYSSQSALPAAPFQFTSWHFNQSGTYVIDRTKPHPLEV